MLSYFFRQLVNSLGIFFRTFRAFFTRRLTGLGARIRRITNFSRQATKVASESFQGAAAAIQKPTKREDYIETKRLFISRSFLVLLAVGLVGFGLLCYLVIWPFLLSHFFTAHFYQGDKRVSDWSGRVIVYYDEKKKQPMYAGRLEEGVLQGEGTQYDQNGLVTYQGSFLDGLRDGVGKSYAEGVLVYDGAFTQGEYEGQGQLYQNGQLVYQGAFSGGGKNGTGTAYQNGSKVYEGPFLNDEYSGEGTLFYPNGTRSYVGSFVSGQQEGTGTAYREDGAVCYKGSFAAGKYDGAGTWYLEEEQGSIQANFTAGETDGAISWFKNGKLWFDGSADDLTPNGFGTLYAQSGKPVFAGELDRGTVNGAWMLGLTADEIRTACGEATLVEADQAGGGFLITDQELGLRVLCSYRQEDADAAVHSLWLSGVGSDATMSSLIPWKTEEEFERWAMGEAGQTGTRNSFQGTAPEASGLPGGVYDQIQYIYDGWSCTALFPQSGGGPAAIGWSGAGDVLTVAGAGAGEEASPAETRLEQLLSSLDLAEGGSGGTGAEYAVGGDVSRLVGLMTTAAGAKQLVDTLLDDYENTQAGAALAESRPLLQQLLTEEQDRLSRGTGDEKRADALQSELDELDQRIAQCGANQEKAALVAQNQTKLDPADYGLSSLVCSFDPAGLDAGALYQAALSYEEGVAAGRYPVDADGLSVSVKAAFINLEMAYQSLQTALAANERAAASAETGMQDYAKGAVDKDTFYHARCAQNDAMAALYSALAEYSRQVNGLNDLSGGWISRNQGWLEDTLPALYQGEITRGQAAAQALQKERGEQEEAARAQLESSPAPGASGT